MNTHTISESGVFTGLSLVILFLASISPVNKIFIASASALVMEVFIKRNKHKPAIFLFFATSTLAVVFLPYKMIAILYFFLFGGYSLVRNIILFDDRYLKKAIMLCYFNLVLFLLFFIANKFFENILQIILNGPLWQNLLIFFVIQLAVLLYDFGLDLASKILLNKLKDIGF